jgi:hypothetical protein
MGVDGTRIPVDYMSGLIIENERASALQANAAAKWQRMS